MPKSCTAPEQSPVIIGRGDQAFAKQFPLWGKGAPTRFWAEKGLVLWENCREDCLPEERFGSMTWRDAGERIRSLNELIFKSSEAGYYADEFRRLGKFTRSMENVIRAAKEQGGPFDEDAIAEYRRRRPKTVIKPQTVDLEF